jgi:hypothetical protein
LSATGFLAGVKGLGAGLLAVGRLLLARRGRGIRGLGLRSGLGGVRLGLLLAGLGPRLPGLRLPLSTGLVLVRSAARLRRALLGSLLLGAGFWFLGGWVGSGLRLARLGLGRRSCGLLLAGLRLA